ncbi:MAG: hypothetical protein ABR564_04720 [Candidatus Dormibacteria bacterium]
MGETSAETRVEIESTREDLNRDLHQLRTRAGVLGGRGKKLGGVGGGVAAASGAVFAALMLARRRRGGRLTAAGRRLPKPLRSPTTRRARRADRALSGGAESARRGGERLSKSVLRRYADERAEAEKRKNPLWRRTAEAALKAGAAAGVTQLVRRTLRGRRGGRATGG